ncbi:MAG: hypothetical protein ACLVL2_20705 [Bacteroides cellulosilyticus]
MKTKNEACHYPASLVIYMFIHYAHTIIRLPIIRQVMMIGDDVQQYFSYNSFVLMRQK